MEKMYKLDRTTFKKQTVEEAANQYYYWQAKSPEERLKAAFYLIQTAWNIDDLALIKLQGRELKPAKRASGRTKDLNDLENLEEL